MSALDDFKNRGGSALGEFKNQRTSTLDEFRGQRNAPPQSLPFDPVSQISPIQEADFSKISPEEREEVRRRIIANPPIQSGLQKVLGGIDVAAEALDRKLPELQHVTRQVRRVARAGVGLASLPGVAIESLALPETAIGEEEAQKSLFGFIPPPIASRGRVVGGFLRGLLKDVAQVPTQLQREAELLIDPKSEFQPTRREDIPLELRTLVELQRQLIGKPTTEEAQFEAVRAGEEEPESLLFGLLVGKQAGRGAKSLVERAQKVKARPPTRIGEVVEPEPFSTVIELEKGKSTLEVSEQAMKSRDAQKQAGISTEDIRRIAPKKSIPTQLHPEGVIVPSTQPQADTPPFVMNNKNIARVREASGLDKIPRPQRKTTVMVYEQALREGLDQKASLVAQDVLNKPRPLRDAEQAGINLKHNDLTKEFAESSETLQKLRESGKHDAANLEAVRNQSILEQLDLLEKASVGREVGRAMSFRRNIRQETLATILAEAEKVKGKRLTGPEKASIKQPYDLEQSLKKQLDEMTKKWEAEKVRTNEIVATRIINSQLRGKRTTFKREKSLLKLTDIESKMRALGERVNDITGASIEALHLVGQYAAELAKIGGLKFEGVVGKVKAKFPDFSRNDVLQGIITKDPKLQGKLRTDATKQVARLKTQAKLILDIEKAEKGIFDPSKARESRPSEIRALQKQLTQLRREAYGTITDATRLERALHLINVLQDHLKNQSRPLRKKRRPDNTEIADAKKNIVELRKIMRTQDVLADLNEQLRTGEFKVTEKPETVSLPVELQRLQVDVKRARQKIRDAQFVLDKPTGVAAVKRGFGEVRATLVTMKATADLSGALRQGLIAQVGLARRGQFRKLAQINAKAVKAFFSENTADMIDNAIRQAPGHYLRERSGLFLSERGAGRATAREEFFMSKLVEKVPYYRGVVKASERHMSTVLNMLRTEMFDSFVRKFPNATSAELTAWADWVNVSTGRGNIKSGRGIASINSLNNIFFAPRFAASRFQTFYQPIKHFQHPRVRNEILKDMGATLGLAVTTLVLADLAGLEVGLDPRESDWLKISFGEEGGVKTFVDIGGGFQQPARLIVGGAVNILDRNEITGKERSKSEITRYDPVEQIQRLLEFKLNPLFGLPREFWRGRSVVGEERVAAETALRALAPIVLEQVWDAYHEQGVEAAIISTPLEIIGFGANTFAESGSRVRRKIRKLAQQDKDKEAKALGLNWNLLNPDDPIRGVRINDSTVFEVSKPKKRSKTFLRPATP